MHRLRECCGSFHVAAASGEVSTSVQCFDVICSKVCVRHIFHTGARLLDVVEQSVCRLIPWAPEGGHGGAKPPCVLKFDILLLTFS